MSTAPCRAVGGMPCRAVPCRAVPCRVVPCRAVPHMTCMACMAHVERAAHAVCVTCVVYARARVFVLLSKRAEACSAHQVHRRLMLSLRLTQI